jgi:glycosyltransferase involved in cell wall biosynthesis
MLTVSVAIPCYNAEPFLSETLGSVFAQTYPVLEVIVVDDGSTDGSAAITEKFGSRVRVIRQKNQGESVARNRAIDEARGNWIALLDADDLWDPGKIAAQVDAIERRPECCCCYTDIYRFNRSGRSAVEQPPESHLWPNARVAMIFDWCVQASSAIVRTDAARSVRFPEEVRFGEDTLFFARLRDHGPFVRVPKALTGYRSSTSQQTHSEDRLLKSIIEKNHWFERRQDEFTPEERAYFRTRLREELVHCHDRLYWRRQIELVNECRSAYQRLFPDDPFPESFRRPLYPSWLFRFRDRVSRLWPMPRGTRG